MKRLFKPLFVWMWMGLLLLPFSPLNAQNQLHTLVAKGLQMSGQLFRLAQDTSFCMQITHDTGVLSLLDSIGRTPPTSPSVIYQLNRLVPEEREWPATTDSFTIARLKEISLRNVPLLLSQPTSPTALAAMSILNLDGVFLGKETLTSPTAFLFLYKGACTFVLFIPRQEGIIQAYANALPPSAAADIPQLKQKLDFLLPKVEVVRLSADSPSIK